MPCSEQVFRSTSIIDIEGSRIDIKRSFSTKEVTFALPILLAISIAAYILDSSSTGSIDRHTVLTCLNFIIRAIYGYSMSIYKASASDCRSTLWLLELLEKQMRCVEVGQYALYIEFYKQHRISTRLIKNLRCSMLRRH